VGVLMLFDNAAYRRKIKSYWYERR
jgi:hypothetical protein